MIPTVKSQIARKTILFTAFLTTVTLLAVLFLFSRLNKQHKERILTEKANHELEAIQVIINDSYTIGDLVGLRKYMDTFSSLNAWEFGEFKDMKDAVLWTIGTRGPETSYKRYYSLEVRTSTGGSLGFLAVLKDQSKEFNIWDQQLIFSISALLGIAMLILGLQTSTLIKILRPINDLAQEIQDEAQRLKIHLSSEVDEDEIFMIKKWFSEVAQSWHDEKEKAARESKFKAIGNLAAQVAHDIRSPLSALNMVASTLTEISEEKRLIIRNASNRINDIANVLLQKGKDLSNVTTKESLIAQNRGRAEPAMLSSLIDSILSEKRVQLRDRPNINLETDLTQGYGLFSRIDTLELSRTISNLINNAVEALVEDQGNILMTLSDDEKIGANVITIKDTGRGIPAELLKRIGTKGLSTKAQSSESGSGIGVFYARKAIEDFGGTFDIESEVNLGTKIKIMLPKCDIPRWFLSKIIIPKVGFFVSVDDDQTIHQIWERRLNSKSQITPSLQHITFTSLAKFEKWYFENYSANLVVVIDQEFLGQSGSGLETIEKLNMAARAILVTSRAEEINIQTRAINMGIKVIPKGQAALVPIITGP